MNARKIYVAIAAVGCLLMLSGWASAGFSFKNLFADKATYTEVSKAETLGANDTVEIKADTEDVNVGLSPDAQAHITYFDSEKKKHAYAYDGGALQLGVEPGEWYDYINFSFGPSGKAVEVLLPADFAGTLRVADGTGAVTVERLKGLDKLDLSVTTGDLSLSDCGAKDVNLSASTGRLSASGLTAEALNAVTATGGIALSGITVGSLTSRFATGSVTLAHAVCETADVRGTTGDIILDGVVGGDIALRASTGSITGRIACAAEEFTVDSSTDTGENNLERVNYGGARKLSVGTSTGDIHITFAE